VDFIQKWRGMDTLTGHADPMKEEYNLEVAGALTDGESEQIRERLELEGRPLVPANVRLREAIQGHPSNDPGTPIYMRKSTGRFVRWSGCPLLLLSLLTATNNFFVRPDKSRG